MGFRRRRNPPAPGVLALLAMALSVCTPQPAGSTPSPATSVVAKMTGTHWAGPEDFQMLHKGGYQVIVAEFGLDDRAGWKGILDAAARAGVQLIAGAFPPPYHKQSNGSWTIDPAGVDFLNLLKANAATVMAVFVFNEPYDSDPVTGKEYKCGYYSAQDLRGVRSKIRSVWDQAKIYLDMDDPSDWAPTGAYGQAQKDCIGDKYRDQNEVADYIGIWAYPFEVKGGYRKEPAIALIRKQIAFIRASMKPAVPVVLGQAFGSKSLGFYFPSKNEMRDWNCTLRRSADTDYIFWYPWRQPERYDDYLAKHTDYLPLTLPDVC
jgi:hypothetical protein